MEVILFPLFLTPYHSSIHPAVAVAYIEDKKYRDEFVKPVIEYYLFSREPYAIVKVSDLDAIKTFPLFRKVADAEFADPEAVVEKIRNQIGTGVRLFIYPCMTEIIAQMCEAGEWKPVLLTEHLGYEDVPTEHLNDGVIKSLASRLQSLIQYL